MSQPQVGVGVIVMKDNLVLMHKRKNAHGDGTWGFVGGHLEFNESPELCAQREAQEECGIKITNIRPARFTNDIFPQEGKHYVTLFMLADYESGEPTLKEEEWAEVWEWHTWDKLPRPLFAPIENLLHQEFNPFA